ncbi:InlB B-repeat-containing protein [Lactococcus laudensis]|uniref:InlB B-repeat-containing protein n=1 Tax=Pseudolactococcus laudensis TaxID=1494461 RepID=UPI002FC7DFC8
MPIQTISFENGLLEGSTDLVTGMPDGTFVEANGNLYNIPDNVPERKVTDGSSVQYKFLYWRLNDKVNVFPGGQWRTNTVVSTPHFVAVWSSFDLNSQWTLSFNTNGATGGSAPYEYTYVDKGKPFIIPGRGSLTKSGASFVGWSDGETTYSEGDAFTPTKNTTLSAVWSQDETQGTVKFVKQSKAGSNPTSQTGEIGTVITLPDAPQNNTAPEDGYIFWGWAKNKNATIPDYYANKSYTLSKGVTTLYGVWMGSLTNYWTQIKVNVNGADGSLPSGITSNNFYSLDSETAIHVFEVPEITKTGYNLIGWDYSKDDQTYQVTDKIELGNMATTRNPGTLTAKWEPITYKVSYDKGDATSGAIPTQDTAIVGYKKAYTLLGNLGYLSKVGFTFVGWTDGTETYIPGQNMAPTTDIVLKPVWKINPTTSGGGNTNNVNIMYVALESGVTGEVPDSVSIPGDYTTSYRVAYPKSDFSYPGYEFLGWYLLDAKGNEVDYSPGSTFIVGNNDLIFYAKWRSKQDVPKDSYAISFNGNGNTSGLVPNTQYVKSGGSATLPGNNTLENKQFKDNNASTGAINTNDYIFVGWSKNKNATADDADVLQKGASISPTSNEVYYAIWDLEKKDITLTFNGNGNTGGTVPAKVTRMRYTEEKIDSLNLGATLTKTVVISGELVTYHFGGWNTQEDGKGIDYRSGSTFNFPKNTTLYAKWIPTKSNSLARILYLGNGNTSGTLPDAFNGPKGSNVTLASTSDVSSRGLKKTGYMFAGWSKTVSGQGIQYVAGQSYTFNENTILYAIWAEDAAYVATPSNITYHPNYTNADGIYNVKGFVDKSMPVDGTTVLHGHKVVKNEENGGAYLGESYALVSYSVTGLPSRKNYAFSGWSTNPQATTPMYTAQQVISLNTTNLDLYAVWTPGNYQIEFDKNASDVTGTMVKQTVNYDETQKLNINKYKRAGYSFMGWNTKSDGSGISYADEQSISNLADADETETLYAKWAKTEYYSILFDLNAGSDRTAKTKQKTIPNLEIGTKYSLSSGIKTASRAGYKFNGWYTTADGTIEMPESIVIPKSNTTYYANWTANNYTVSYDKNTGSGTMADQNFTYDVAKNLSQNNFGKDGYVFTGWNTSADGSGIAYSNSQSVSNLTTASGGKVTLYAQWQAKSEFGDSNSKTTDPTDMLPTTGELVSNYITILGVIILVSIAYVGFKRNKKYRAPLKTYEKRYNRLKIS